MTEAIIGNGRVGGDSPGPTIESVSLLDDRLTTGPDRDAADEQRVYRVSVRCRVVNEPWPMASCCETAIRSGAEGDGTPRDTGGDGWAFRQTPLAQ